jgi:hypothetical protein
MQSLKTINKILLCFTFSIIIFSGVAYAAPNQNFPSANGPSSSPPPSSPCDKVTDNNSLKECLRHDKLDQDINKIIDFLSAGVGVVVVGSIIMGGIQYTLAGDNSSKVTAAKQRIANSIFALIAFFFIFAFLQWIIPGGVLFTG